MSKHTEYSLFLMPLMTEEVNVKWLVSIASMHTIINCCDDN